MCIVYAKLSIILLTSHANPHFVSSPFITKTMTYWIRAYNHKRFRVDDFIHDFGFIDWHQTTHFAVGDIVFLYATAPDSRINFMMEVEKVNLDYRQLAKDEGYYKSQTYYDEWLAERESQRYARLAFLKALTSPALCLANLQEHGMSRAPRSPRRLSLETVDYILTHMD